MNGFHHIKAEYEIPVIKVELDWLTNKWNLDRILSLLKCGHDAITGNRTNLNDIHIYVTNIDRGDVLKYKQYIQLKIGCNYFGLNYGEINLYNKL